MSNQPALRVTIANARTLSSTDGYWPHGLRAPGAPRLRGLCVTGDPALLARPAIAITGPIDPSAAEIRTTIGLITGLSAAGWVIVATDEAGIQRVALQAAARMQCGSIRVRSMSVGVPIDGPPASVDVCEVPADLEPNSRSTRRKLRVALALASKVLVVGSAHDDELYYWMGKPVGLVGRADPSLGLWGAHTPNREHRIESAVDAERLR